MGYATKWANKVVYNACKMQIEQPCLVTILLNPSLLDSAFFFTFHVQVYVVFLSTFQYGIFMMINMYKLTLIPLYELDFSKREEQTPG